MTRGRMGGRELQLTRSQASYISRAFRLRCQLTNEALAKRFGVSKSTINDYGNSHNKKAVAGQFT